MKRRTVCITAIGMMALCLGACGAQQAPAAPPATETEPEVVSEAATEEAVPETEEAAVIPETEETEEAAAENEYPSVPLPEYHYYGPEDWADYGEAISAFMLENSFGEEAADLSVCTPVVLKVDDSDPSDVKVWGEYWLDQFQLQKTTLFHTAGGSFGGVAHLDATGAAPMLISMDPVEDGTDNGPSIERLFGPEGLTEAYSEAVDNINEYRAKALSYYINENGLYITQFQDFGWPPVPIPGAPETREEDQIVDHVSNYAYTTQFDMRQICADETEDCDLFSSVHCDDWNDFLIEIYSSDEDMDAIISNIDKANSDYDSWKDPERDDQATFAGVEGCTLLSIPGPYEDGQKVFTVYLVPREEDTLVVEVTSDYSADDEKQMATDGIIEGFLGRIELK